MMLTFLPPSFALSVEIGPNTRDRARSKQLMTALDAINRRMLRDTLFYAASGVRREWSMARSMKSQHFTTDWEQLLRVDVGH
jgi:DNA polymerase V